MRNTFLRFGALSLFSIALYAQNFQDTVQVLLRDFATYQLQERYALNLMKQDMQQGKKKFQDLCDKDFVQLEQRCQKLRLQGTCNREVGKLEKAALDDLQKAIEATKEIQKFYKKRL